MEPLDLPDIEIVRRAGRPDPIDDRRLRRLLASGAWTRIAPGAFAATAAWKALRPIERHRVRVHEGLRRMRPGVTASHLSAAALWDMDLLGSWPDRIEVTVPRAGGGRSSGLVVRHSSRTADGPDATPFGMHLITTPAQTALDVARTLPFVRAVSVVDQAVWTGRPGGALTTRAEMLDLREHAPGRGDARALRAISFASDLAANPRESQSRAVIAQLGFPRPRLQERRLLASGRLVYGDFYFPSHDHWGELDGRSKYVSPDFGQDRVPAEIVIDEKNRENEIRREVRGFSRWEPADADHPRRLYDILTRDGLPSSLPRP